MEELGEGGFGDGLGRREGGEEGGVERGGGGGGVEEREERGREVAAEGVGLVGPVEAVRASGVAGEVVLGGGVVFEDLGEVLVLWVLLVGK